MNNCKPPKDNGQINIAAWAIMGLDLASDYGKTLDDLITCLSAANALRTIFDMASQQQMDGEDINVRTTATELSTADNSEQTNGITEAVFIPSELENFVPRSLYEDCRNELCLKCGEYKMRHKGTCDGCRWLEY